MTIQRPSLIAALAALAALRPVVCSAGPAAVDNTLLAAEEDGRNWASYGRTFSEDHFSPLTEITTQNVSKLRLAWSYDLNVPLRADSQPLEADGVVYVATGLSVVQALDAVSGKLLWRYDPKLTAIAGRKLRPSWGIRGLALWKGRVYVGTQDGRLLALNAADGRLVWSAQTMDKKMDKMGEATITGAPRVFNGKVVIGEAGAERWARGAVSCFDAATGKFLWRFYTVPGNPDDGFEDDAMRMAANTWSGEWWKYGGGGTVWNAMTYDPEFNRLYIGTGNGGPWNWKIRNPKGGDALFLASIVALDADTGKYVWHYQENPNEAWDYNATMDMEMAKLTVDGVERKVLMQAPKNGFLYVLDRTDGKLISAGKIGRVDWAVGIDLKSGRPIENPGIRYEEAPVLMWPGTYGTHNWQPMAYSPVTHLVYIPTIHQADQYSMEGVDPKKWQRTPDAWNTGMSAFSTSDVKLPSDEFSSMLQAWDPVTQRAVWKVPTPGVINGGTMATAGGLVFQGHVDGTFHAFDATTGKALWQFSAGSAVTGAPMSYSAGGHQYVAVLSAPPSGSPSSTLPVQSKYGWQYREHPRRLLAFSLDGTATMPQTAPPRITQPLKDDNFKVDTALAVKGETEFVNGCMACHGVGAVASGGAPDLRASTIPLDAAAFSSIVHDGVLLEKGMPAFGEISNAGLLALQHYIRREANGATSGSAAPKGP